MFWKMIFWLCINMSLLAVGEALGAGPETVEVVNVSTLVGQSGKYLVTFKRQNGLSGEIVLQSRTTAKFLVIQFCPDYTGRPEKPCPRQM